MAKMKMGMIVVLALCAGLVGGALSNQYFREAFANRRDTHADVVRAEKFELVDTNGTVFASLSQTDCTVSFRLGSTDDSLIHFTVSENISAMAVRSRQHGSVDLSSDLDGPRISIQDALNNDRAVLGEVFVKPARKKEGTILVPFSLTFYDKGGGVTWSAPENEQS